MTIPNPVTTPPVIPLPINAVTQGLVWTPAQWNSALAQFKPVLRFFVLTSGSAAVRLTTDGLAAVAGNVGVIPTGTAVGYTATIIIRDRSGTGIVNTYNRALSLTNNATGTVADGAGNPAIAAGPTAGGGLALAAVPTIVADNVLKGWNISYTPPVANAAALEAECIMELLVVQ